MSALATRSSQKKQAFCLVIAPEMQRTHMVIRDTSDLQLSCTLRDPKAYNEPEIGL